MWYIVILVVPDSEGVLLVILPAADESVHVVEGVTYCIHRMGGKFFCLFFPVLACVALTCA